MTRITVSSAGKKQVACSPRGWRVRVRWRGVMSGGGGQESSWMCITQSMVVVSPEEYDAVRARSPELCEGYLIPVVVAHSLPPAVRVHWHHHLRRREAEAHSRLRRC